MSGQAIDHREDLSTTMTEDPPSTLTALLLRLARFHPRFRAELATLTRLLQENEITDEVFDQALKVDAVTRRLRGENTPIE